MPTTPEKKAMNVETRELQRFGVKQKLNPTWIYISYLLKGTLFMNHKKESSTGRSFRVQVSPKLKAMNHSRNRKP